MKEEPVKKVKEKKTAPRYPLKRGIKVMLQYAGFCFLLPAAFMCAALLCAFSLFRNMKIGALTFGGSTWLLAVGMVALLAAAAFFFMRAYKYGTFSAYYFAVNSRRFKREMKRLLSNAVKKYTKISEGKYDESERDITRYLQFCLGSIHSFKKFRQSNGTLAKLENVTYKEACKMSEVLEVPRGEDAAGEFVFPYQEFLAAVKKVYFCIEERFAGVSAKAYKGEGSYAFISYSHRNSKVVLDVIKRLQEAKLNVWFDEGITEGDDWMDHIARKIDTCSHFVMFQSHAYAKSINCNVEIKRALKTNRTIIRVILEASKMAEGVEMYLDAIQAIDCRAGVDEGKLVKLIELLQPVKPAEKEVKKVKTVQADGQQKPPIIKKTAEKPAEIKKPADKPEEIKKAQSTKHKAQIKE